MIKRAIIYGATGVVGRALLQLLLANGVEVLVLGRQGGRTEALPPLKNLTCRTCSLADLAHLENGAGVPYDAFFHLGWAGTNGEARGDLALQLKNLNAALAAVRTAARFGCRVFVGAGSQAEYGVQNVPLTPSTATLPQNAYGAAKLAAGHLTREAAKVLHLRHIWVRIVSVYGPHDNARAVFSYVASELLNGRTPALTEGRQLWDYLYANDAAEALWRLALNGQNGATYVLGSGSTRPLRDYIEALRDHLVPTAKLDFGKIKPSPDTPHFLCADISALTKDTDWRPTTTFAAGIAKTAAFLKTTYSSAHESSRPLDTTK